MEGMTVISNLFLRNEVLYKNIKQANVNAAKLGYTYWIK